MIVVLAHGTFDLLHVGHLHLLDQAAALGDRLVVTLTADLFVNKGPGRPICDEEERAYALRRIRGVSEVEICREPTGLSMIRKHRPTYYVKGADYRTGDKHGSLEAERQLVESYGGRLLMLDTPRWSSSELIARLARWREAQAA